MNILFGLERQAKLEEFSTLDASKLTKAELSKWVRLFRNIPRGAVKADIIAMVADLLLELQATKSLEQNVSFSEETLGRYAERLLAATNVPGYMDKIAEVASGFRLDIEMYRSSKKNPFPPKPSVDIKLSWRAYSWTYAWKNIQR
ncbi:hypothetical protein HC928_10300 [bacterium]|nr:hypothetical protein [bacterium]